MSSRSQTGLSFHRFAMISDQLVRVITLQFVFCHINPRVTFYFTKLEQKLLKQIAYWIAFFSVIFFYFISL